LSSESKSGYTDLQETKKRLNISDSLTASDEKIMSMGRETDNYINTQINLHALTPISNPDPEIVSMANSCTAAIFNYWQTPIKDRSLDGINEWKKAIQEHILAVYGRKNPNLLSGGTTFGTTTGF
jgi:hypothetical protein